MRNAFRNMLMHYYIMSNNKEIFEHIYNNELWNGGRKDIPLSGPGSSLENAKECSTFLDNFISINECKSVLDLGCGDLTWIKKTQFFNNSSIKYTGVDVVDSLIDSHSNNYPEKTFLCEDLVNYKNINSNSLIIIRDVIFHLKNQEILTIFDNIKNKFEYILITSCKNNINSDSFDKWHFSRKNIHVEPFNKSHDYEVAIYERVFDRNLLLYTHDNFYK
uniref:Methyltransferase domain-containing protein n=1 Tax=viral metagenome TaxID=1070528 RepID=A0A6C0CNM4_9ZZZZ